MLANSLLLFAFDVDAKQSLEVLMEVFEFHLIDHVYDSKIVFEHLIRVSKIGANEFVMLEVLYFDF